MRLALSARATIIMVVALALVEPVQAGHEHEYVPITTRFFMRRTEGTFCPGDTYLSEQVGQESSACGYLLGLPAGEEYHHGLYPDNTIVTFTTRDGMHRYLDASRNVVGNVRVGTFGFTQAPRAAVGQVRVDITVRGLRSDASPLVIGTHSSQVIIVNPLEGRRLDFPFVVRPPSDLDRVRLDAVSIDVDIRGWHLLSGFQYLDGHSWLDLPGYERRSIAHAAAPSP